MDINRVARGPALERVAVIVMAALIGRFWAAGLFVATSIAGALLLRRFGRGDANRIGFAPTDASPASGNAHVATALGQSFLYFRVL
jgi:UPF0716 family protein affecting phage T7 exclusion